MWSRNAEYILGLTSVSSIDFNLGTSGRSASVLDGGLLLNRGSERESFSIEGSCMHAVRRSMSDNFDVQVSIKCRRLLVLDQSVGDVALKLMAGKWESRLSSVRDGA